MSRDDGGTTNPILLIRLGDWRDRDAWFDFVARYDPVIRSACHPFGLDADNTEELCQQVWIELARRMCTFRYDPGKTFRAWLRTLCRSRAKDLLRKKKAIAVDSLEDHPTASFRQIAIDEGDGCTEPERSLILRQAQVVQEAVRRRVDARTWQVFWNIAIEGQSVRETSEASGISYAAAFATQKRVSRILREEGRWLLAERRRTELCVEVPEIV